MSSVSKKRDIFNELRSFLVTTEKLDSKDARIYVLALKRGIVKSSDVSDQLQIRRTTAIARLKALAKKGFFEFAPKETAKKRPYGIEFKAVHPRIALEDVVKKAVELPHLLELFDEHWEVLAEKPVQETEMWFAKSPRVARCIGASMLSGAMQGIKIHSHDCSWFEGNDIHISLENAISNGATVTVVASNMPENIAKRLTDIGASLYECKEHYGVPFCLVDNLWLFLPTQYGALSRQYCSIRTNDKYMIENYAGLFKTALSCSTPRGK